MKHSLLLSLLLFVCLGVFGQSSSVPPQVVTTNHLESSTGTYQESIQSLKDQNQNLQKQINLLKEDVNNLSEKVKNYEKNINDRIDFLQYMFSIFFTIVSVLITIFGIVFPVFKRKDLERRIDEINNKMGELLKNNLDDTIEKEKITDETNALKFCKEGISKFKEGLPGEAIRNFDKALKLMNDLPEAYFYRGLSNYIIHDSDAAMNDIDKAIEYNKYFADAYYIKCLLEFELGKATDAYQNLDYAKKMKGDVVANLPVRELLTNRMKELDNAIIKSPQETGYSQDKIKLIHAPNYPGEFIINSGVKEIGDGAFRLSGKITSIIIPDTVTWIGDGAFDDCVGLTKIELPDNITMIGNGAFGGCTSLTSIKIPNKVTAIGKNCFCYCKSLTSIEISSSVKTIGDGAFLGCSRLNMITVDDNNQYYCSQDGVLYSKDMTELIAVPGAKESIEILNSVTEIKDSAFDHCEKLSSIVIPQSVAKIPSNAFFDCIKLQKIIVADNNKNYRSKDGVLYSNNMSKLITMPGGKNSIKIPTSVTEIGDDAFYSCIDLKSIKFPVSVTKIGKDAFHRCVKLKEIHICCSDPVVFSRAFDFLNPYLVTLYVPKDSLKIYKDSGYYRGFKIEEDNPYHW